MSLTSKAALFGACGFTFGIVFYVHYRQWADKQQLHDGVVRDIQKQQRKKIENLHILQQQIEMGKILKNQENQDDAIALKPIEESEKSKS